VRALLDECVPRQLRLELAGHDVPTVADMGWGGIKNGDLLRQAAAEFDVLLTTDRNMEFQQKPSIAIALLVVEVGSNDIDKLRPFVPQMLDALTGIQRGEVRHVRA
jgi:hypothetical protein